MHPVIADVTSRIAQRSQSTRFAYLQRMQAASLSEARGRQLPCANRAHVVAAMPSHDKLRILEARTPNIGIISAYNDMLSAHQPLEAFPALIKRAVSRTGATAQFAGGVPAMCDGVTQGQPGMEISLFSRDVIAMATAVALSHDVFDAAVCLGTCDKIVPGLLIGALAFGHLPVVFAPAGPMATGLSNTEKSRIRALYAEGKVSREALLEAEVASYHSAGTCTFYGTANSNQMLMEIMGLHLPGTAFIHPGTPLRDALTEAAGTRAAELATDRSAPLYKIVDEKCIVNAIIGLLATGGSTNHTMHLVAIAAAAGIQITWDDFDALSRIIPLIARVYPNGSADINHFQAAGGMALVIRHLLDAGLLHEDVTTVAGPGLRRYTTEPILQDGTLIWREGPTASADPSILRPVAEAFQPEGGIRVLSGNLGRAVIKVSAVSPEHRVVQAPAVVFDDQQELLDAFQAGLLDRDFIAVVRFQGAKANGMPELHSLSPTLGVLQDRGFRVALVTDGRMSGASGKVPSAIHISPEALDGGPIARIQDGDILRLDAEAGTLSILIDAAMFNMRRPATINRTALSHGRELFAHMREAVASAEAGASVFSASSPAPRRTPDWSIDPASNRDPEATYWSNLALHP